MRRLTSGFVVSMLTAAGVSAATDTVTNTADSVAGSLRQASLDANGGVHDCPLPNNTPGQMAVFIVKTFLLD